VVTFRVNPCIVVEAEPETVCNEGVLMGGKSPKKDTTKKAAASSLKEKRAEKKAKASEADAKSRKS
jgi:hypothetical protein